MQSKETCTLNLRIVSLLQDKEGCNWFWEKTLQWKPSASSFRPSQDYKRGSKSKTRRVTRQAVDVVWSSSTSSFQGGNAAKTPGNGIGRWTLKRSQWGQAVKNSKLFPECRPRSMKNLWYNLWHIWPKKPFFLPENLLVFCGFIYIVAFFCANLTFLDYFSFINLHKSFLFTNKFNSMHLMLSLSLRYTKHGSAWNIVRGLFSWEGKIVRRLPGHDILWYCLICVRWLRTRENFPVPARSDILLMKNRNQMIRCTAPPSIFPSKKRNNSNKY